MFLLIFSALGGAITVEQKFETYKEAVTKAFALEEGRTDARWSIEAIPPKESDNAH